MRELSKKIHLVLALQSALLLAACGGGGDKNKADPVATTQAADLSSHAGTVADGTPVPVTALQVSGRVLNVGYLGNTVVCADLDEDGTCTAELADHTATTTNASGQYALSVPTSNRGVHLLAVVRPSSVDSASTDASPITITQGWTLAAPLEYADGATSAADVNISPVTATYAARLATSGRNRLSTKIAMFTRVIYATNIDQNTGAPILPVDFDYVAQSAWAPGLANRIKALTSYLSTRADTAGAPLTQATTAAVMGGWYNTYTGPTSTAAGVPVDATKIATLSTNNSVETYLTNSYRYFSLKSQAMTQLRTGVVDNGGLTRIGNAIDTLNLVGLGLSSGAVVPKYEQWKAGIWSTLIIPEDPYVTYNRAGQVKLVGAKDYLQPNAISYADGNRVTYILPVSNARFSIDLASANFSNYFIEDWFNQQLNYTKYKAGDPSAADPAAKPACYTGTATTVSSWYSGCQTTYRTAYVTEKGGSTASQDSTGKARANYYDVTLQDSYIKLPLTQTCGTGATPLAKVSTLGTAHCNWAIDSNAGHTLDDLFALGGITVNSWTQTTSATGLPQTLTLTLTRTDASIKKGTGTIYSVTGAGSGTAVTENIVWEIDSANPRLVLISWPFRNTGSPLVNTAGSAAASVLPAHFSVGDFAATPSTHTSPNYRKLALALQDDGVVMTGQYYGVGYTTNERHLNKSALEIGIQALNYVIDKLYTVAGFK